MSCDSPFACVTDLDEDDVGLYCDGFADDGAGTCTRKSVVDEACDPEDWNPCAEGRDGDGIAGWCDPAQGRCVADGSAICQLADFPKARPSTP